MKLTDLFLNRFLYKDTSQNLETKDSVFVAADSTPATPTSIPSGGAAQDINIGNVTINGEQITPGTLPQTVLDVSNWGWGQTCAFTSTDADTVSWGGGNFKSADGTTYVIDAGNTGNMGGKTYIYLDLLTSTTAYQKTTTPGTAVGIGKVLVAVAEPGTGLATYNLSEATQIVGDNILANSINASKIVAGSITTSQLNFTPVQSTNVVASINASAEGIQISGARISISGSTTFSSGYDPTTKLANANGAVTATNLDTTVISGGKIITGLLTASNITTGTLDASTVTVSNLNASNITTGTLSGITIKTSSNNERVEITNDTLKFYVGNSLKATMDGSSAGSGGIKNTGDFFISNNRTYWIAASGGGSTTYGGVGITSSDQFWLTLGTDNSFYIKNNAQNANYLTVSSTRTYINGYLLLQSFSTNQSTTEGSIWHYVNGATHNFRGFVDAGWVVANFDLTAA